MRQIGVAGRAEARLEEIGIAVRRQPLLQQFDVQTVRQQILLWLLLSGNAAKIDCLGRNEVAARIDQEISNIGNVFVRAQSIEGLGR